METTQVTTPNTVGFKSPEQIDTETTTRIQPTKLLSSLSNGVLKRHHRHHHHHHLPPPVVVVYKECLKNHAANLGVHAVDGCGEFMPSPSSTPTDPTSLKCAACGCHRNFHRREPEDPLTPPQQPPNTTATIDYQPHHRHHPLPPQPPVLQSGHRSPSSLSPPPISSSYYTSAPAHMLLALSGGISGPQDATNFNQSGSPNTRKRFRTKFKQTQKEKMYEFSERVGWKMQKRDEDLIHEFCDEIGVDKRALKVWMHNNKNTFGRRDVNGAPPTTTLNNGVSTASIAAPKNNNNGNGNGDGDGNDENKVQGINIERDHHQYETHVGTNGSSSTS